MEDDLCRRAHEYGDGMDAGRTTKAGAEAKGYGASAEAPAARFETSASHRQGVGIVTARGCMEDHFVETGRQRETHFALRRCSCEARSPRLLARRTPSGRMASGRMAEGGD